MNDGKDSNQQGEVYSNSGQEKVVPPWMQSQAAPQEQAAPEQVHEEENLKTETKVEAQKAETPASVSPTETIKKSPFKLVAPIIVVLVLGVGIYFLATKLIIPFLKERGKKEPTTKTVKKEAQLVWWGLWEPKEVMQPLIDDYQKENPGVKIDYIQQSRKDYRERLQTSLEKGEGPDIFRIHNTWPIMFKGQLAPAPEEVVNELDLEKNYFPVIASDFSKDGQVVGVPLGFDCLLLYYNEDLFKEANKSAPSSWDEMRKTAINMTVKDENANMQTAGAGLGCANNVNHFSDILGLLMLQSGADFGSPRGSETQEALDESLQFYTMFLTQYGVWDKNFPPSTFAFAQGKVAMIFAPSWRAHEIAQINPDLNFTVTSVPQLPRGKKAWATYWGEAVSGNSKNADAAWDFLRFLSKDENLTKLYTEATKVRGFGEPYPKKSLAGKLADDEVAGVVVGQGSYAESWHMCTRTHDNGINDKIIKYYENAVNAIINQGESVSDVIPTITAGVEQVLEQYSSSEQ